MDLHLEAQLTAEDYVDAQNLNGWKRLYFMYASLTTVIFCTPIIIINPAQQITWLLWLAGLAIVLLAELKIVPMGIAKRTKKIFAQQKELQLPYEAEITDDYCVLRSEGRGEWKFIWQESYKWKGNEKLVLLYPSERLF